MGNTGYHRKTHIRGLMGNGFTADLTAVQAIIETDPVLSSLFKQLHEARVRYLQLCGDMGPDDPMTSIAADMVESLFSALQTRWLETIGDTSGAPMPRTVEELIEIQASEKKNAEAKPLHRDTQAAEEFTTMLMAMFFMRWSLSGSFARTMSRDLGTMRHDFEMASA